MGTSFVSVEKEDLNNTPCKRSMTWMMRENKVIDDDIREFVLPPVLALKFASAPNFQFLCVIIVS